MLEVVKSDQTWLYFVFVLCYNIFCYAGMFAFVVLRLRFSTKPRDCWEKRLRNDLLCVWWDVIPQLDQSISCGSYLQTFASHPQKRSKKSDSSHFPAEADICSTQSYIENLPKPFELALPRHFLPSRETSKSLDRRNFSAVTRRWQYSAVQYDNFNERCTIMT